MQSDALTQPAAEATAVDTPLAADSNGSCAVEVEVATAPELTVLKATHPLSNGKPVAAPNGPPAGNQFPPPKTDKPRPHVCGTCGRSFARLEHLKRHERSHTKEKPFECPECTRCFARRDLLLRHQQKLHMTNTTSSRPRANRRESVSSTVSSANKVRKNSVANLGATGMGNSVQRPRANTISHLDIGSLGLGNGMGGNLGRLSALGINPNPPVGMHGMPLNFNYQGMSTTVGHHVTPHGLPKLDLHNVNNLNASNSLRTAPPMASFEASTGFSLDQLFGPGTTINPAQLHSGPALSSGGGMDHFHALSDTHMMVPDGDDFGWMRNWNMQMHGLEHDEQAIDESSPSRISSGDSPDDFNDSLTNSANIAMPAQNNMQWDQQDLSLQQTISNASNFSNNSFHLDPLGSNLPYMDGQIMSPPSLHDHVGNNDAYFHQNMIHQAVPGLQQQPEMTQAHVANLMAPSLSNFSSDSPHVSSSSMNDSGRHSSVTSASTDSITEATRQALLHSLSQPSVFGTSQRKYSQPNISSPLSPGPGTARNGFQGPSLPSVADIRRYVDSFIQFALPHLPVCHVPTLSFDPNDDSHSFKAQGDRSYADYLAGNGCLILSMAAIGALHEYDHPTSKELFEAAKKMISLYLEERRKADMSAAVNGNGNSDSARQTPLWLVQAMLLNVIYGHQCGDKTAADIASNHCAALVSLARAAELAKPSRSRDINMGEHEGREIDLHGQWLSWKMEETRKRTLFSIFILSSLLTTAYNQTPTIMNSEILLDLPCDEALWAAETAQEWQKRGGMAMIEATSTSFAGALSTLLTANQRQGNARTGHNSSNPLGTLQSSEAFSDELRPSTFGCLVLISALHNYIWETRSRHHSRLWTSQETESMFSHIEPALNAWQAAWKANEHHRLERPNPFGLGPLSADSIPLLDQAFVRLFVNLGRSKEAFWARDFDAMSNELARGTEIVQHAESDGPDGSGIDEHGENGQRRMSQAQITGQASSRRERHLRKAAFYAADSLTIACSYNLTYADASAHELPIQSAMCFFDCAQVLAEWAGTVQERVGRYLGVLGRDQIDFTQVPAIMLLETEDIELLHKIEQITGSLEAKRFQQENMLSLESSHTSGFLVNSMPDDANLSARGYGSKILRVSAMMLEKAVVWPGE